MSGFGSLITDEPVSEEELQQVPSAVTPQPKSGFGAVVGGDPVDDPSPSTRSGRNDPGRRLPRGQRPPKPDEWAIDNPELDALARQQAATQVGDIERSTPEDALIGPRGQMRAELMGDALTFGAQQKVQGLIELIRTGDPDQREFKERVRKYYMENLREEIPESIFWELAGGLMQPGGQRKIVPAIAEGAGLAGVDTAMRNLPSEGAEGLPEAVIGGGGIGGTAATVGRTIAPLPDQAPGSKPFRTDQNPEAAGTRFKEAAEGDFETLKAERKAALEQSIQDAPISFTQQAGPRLQYHVRSGIQRDLATGPQNQGLATNINMETTPHSMEILSQIDALEGVETLGLREIDNLMKSISAAEARGLSRADEIVLGKIKDRVLSFTSIGEYNNIIDNIPERVLEGDPKAVREWRKANQELGDYLDIQRGKKGAERKLNQIIQDKDMTGRDLAKYTWGTAVTSGEGSKGAKGMVDLLKSRFGTDSQVWQEYRRGLMEVLETGDAKTTTKRINNFLDNNPELAASILSKQEIRKLRRYATREGQRLAKRNDRGRGLVDLILTAGAGTVGGPAGAVASVLAQGVTGSTATNSFNQLLAEGLAQTSKTTSRQFGEEVGRTVEEYIPDEEMLRNALPGALGGQQ